jgi:hypothetical protein
MTFESSLCRYSLNIGFSTFDDNKTTDIFKYLVETDNEIAGGSKPTNSNPSTTVTFSDGLLSCSPTGIGPYNPACTAAAGNISIVKTGASWVWSFANVTDYNKYQTEYNAAISNVTPIGPVPTNSDINYYRFLRFHVQKFNNNLCGDTATTNTNVILHYLTPVVFDSIGLTMSFTVTAIDPTPYYATLPPTCAGTCSSLQWAVFVNSGASSVTNLSILTGTTQVTACDATYYIQATGVDTVKEIYWIKRYVAFDYLVPEYPFPLANGWYNNAATSNYYDYRYVCTITDMGDPVNNFTIVSKIDPVTGAYSLSNNFTVYEIAGGIITTPSGGCP